ALRARTLAKLSRDPAVERVQADGTTWLRPAGEADAADGEARVRFLAPFDPVVWDRPRFERFWGWDYRFEAYTPAAKRRFGYYALPLLWRADVIGWVNAAALDGTLTVVPGYARRAPADAIFRRELEAEAERLREFLGSDRVALRKQSRR
ncbi:MAG: winged helix DNA-binding domain-containing protein, partial [Burkholderiales bacterium]|nr:winged helix DNA-binding domain-containing protein [Burkholderiales bacterium]